GRTLSLLPSSLTAAGSYTSHHLLHRSLFLQPYGHPRDLHSFPTRRSSDLPSTNTFTTVVTDNGSPPLSATNTFNVVVNELNSAPVLPAVTNYTINELTTLTDTNTATDADIPANTLSYTLSVASSAGSVTNA